MSNLWRLALPGKDWALGLSLPDAHVPESLAWCWDRVWNLGNSHTRIARLRGQGALSFRLREHLVVGKGLSCVQAHTVLFGPLSRKNNSIWPAQKWPKGLWDPELSVGGSSPQRAHPPCLSNLVAGRDLSCQPCYSDELDQGFGVTCPG